MLLEIFSKNIKKFFLYRNENKNYILQGAHFLCNLKNISPIKKKILGIMPNIKKYIFEFEPI